MRERKGRGYKSDREGERYDETGREIVSGSADRWRKEGQVNTRHREREGEREREREREREINTVYKERVLGD